MFLRKRMLVGTACLIAGAAIVLFVWFNSEPRYQGRTISDWTYAYATSQLDGDQKGEQEAEFAIRSIGTNGIPKMVACLSQEIGAIPYPVMLLRMPVLGDWLFEMKRKRDDKAWAAIHFFRLLGPVCTSAIPQL
ncbi:MAG: hypothetical protein ACK4UN_15220 [Limisphaerales bacterium]